MRKLATALSRVADVMDTRDAHAYSGTLLIAIGLGFVYWPAALIAPGTILLYMALRRVD